MSGINISEFIEKILQTEVNDAKSWLADFEKGFPISMWQMFMRMPITAESIKSIAGGISLQISRASRRVPEEQGIEVIRNGHRFLKEIHRKAKEFGMEIDPRDVDWIFSPGLEQIGEVLHHAG